MRSLAALVLGAFLCAPVVAAKEPAPSCAAGQEQYWGECRPASVCEPGCFPQANMCRKRPVAPKHSAPWAKFLDHERHAVPLYDKRLDRGGMNQQHLAYIPDLNIAIGSRLSPKWMGLFWDIDLFVDEGADGVLERAYRFDIRVDDAVELFYTELPDIITRSRKERDPLSYLYGSLESFKEGAKHDVMPSDRLEYAALIAKLDEQMCRVEE